MTKIFRGNGRRYLDFSYVPPRLPHREKEIAILLELLEPIIMGEIEAYSIPVLYGKTGTGKTTTAKKVLEILSEKEMKIHAHTMLINCGINQKPFSVVQRISHQILETYVRGYSLEEMIEMIYDALEIRDEFLILVLDEIDELLRFDRGRLLQVVSKIGETRGVRRIFPVLIARRYEQILDLPDHVRNLISGPLIHFKPYTIDQMRDIIIDRIRLSINENCISENAIKVISIISSVLEGGDARAAISILLNAGDLAEREGDNKILVDHVRRIYEQRSSYIYRFLGKLEPKLTRILSCLAEIFSKKRDEYIINTSVMSEIQLCMANRFMQPLTFREIEGLLEKLCERKILLKVNNSYMMVSISPMSILM